MFYLEIPSGGVVFTKFYALAFICPTGWLIIFWFARKGPCELRLITLVVSYGILIDFLIELLGLIDTFVIVFESG